MNRIFSLIAAWSCLIGLSNAAILHVDASASPGGNGSSPALAFRKLQDALAIAAPKDVIRMAEGVYFPDEGNGLTDDDVTLSFTVPDSVTILGGYQKGETDQARDPVNFPTILSGDLKQDDTDPNNDFVILSSNDQIGGNSHHVVRVTGASGQVTLDGLIITAGDASTASPNHAGGLLADNSVLVLNTIWLVGNKAAGRGGALHLDGCNAQISNCRFSGNAATARGGAVGTLNNTDSEFINCLFWGNISERGGALNLNNSDASFWNCTISGNHGTLNGGGIQAANSASFILTDSIIWNNLAGDPGSTSLAGSSINLISSATNTLSASSIIENTSGSDPDFVSEFNPANAPGTGGNLRLSRGSPARNAGTATSTASQDLDGNLRIQGEFIDLGAFEATPFSLFVDDTAGGSNNGTSWNNAYTTLQPALAAAQYADQILIAAGVYTPATENDSFEIPADIQIYGGYPNGGGARDPDTHRSILSGDVTGNDVNADGNFIAEATTNIIFPNAETVVTSASGLNLTPRNLFDGLVITAGNAFPVAPGLFGNESTQGGGVYLVDDFPVFRDCLFSGNSSYEGGSAVYSSAAPASLLTEDGPTFENCEFTGNATDFFGGAMRIQGGRTVIEDCLFDGNRGSVGSTLTHDGTGGTIDISNTIIRNSIQFGGSGAIVIQAGPVMTTMINCQITGCQDNAIELYGSLRMHGCTLASNGGRPVLKSGGSSSLTVWNSIFWQNAEFYGSFAGGSLAQFHHSLIEAFVDTAPGFANQGNLNGNLNANNPDFVSSPSFMSAPTSAGDFRLQLSSPAISAGDNDETESTTDLDGNPRISGHTVDLGAYEFVLPDADKDGISDAYEQAHTSPSSATSLNANSNLDGDAWTALQEFAFGTDPNVAEPTSAAYRISSAGDPLQLALIWEPNPDAIHYLKIIPEQSNDLGITDPWAETATTPASTAFGGQPGEFQAKTTSFLPLPPTQFLRLRVEK